jgi:hypothetical protein
VSHRLARRAGPAADAILGVNFYATDAPQSFLKFDRAFVCMFRIAAGETWVDELPVVNEDGNLNIAFASFLFSFVLIVNWTLLQARPVSQARIPPERTCGVQGRQM